MLNRFAMAAMTLAAVSGCQQLECGEGTLEKDGVCVSSEVVADTCGPATVRDPVSGQCVPNALLLDGGAVICDSESAEVSYNDAGIPVCKGTGVTNCASPPTCPTPAISGRVSVCGTIYDTETYAQIENAADILTATLYDPLQFVSNPDMPTPIVQANIDSCGRFVAKDVIRPANGLIAVGIDDVGGDNYMRTGVAMTISSGEVKGRVRAFATTHVTDAKWTNDSGPDPGLANGDTFGEQGFMLMYFIDPEAPPAEWTPPFQGKLISGVRPSGQGGPVGAANEVYWSDSPGSLGAMNPAGTETGANGAAGLINLTGVNPYGGAGSEPSGCTWSTGQGGTFPNLIYIAERTLLCP